MHIRNTKISKAFALLSAGLVVAGFTINSAAWATTADCIILLQGGNGCLPPQEDNTCAWYAPNFGVTWYQKAHCVFVNHVTTTADLVPGTCYSQPNGGCCNNLDIAQYCPSAVKCDDYRNYQPSQGCTYSP